MLRSLVGSEMCIRDSPWVALHEAHGWLGRDRRAVRAALPGVSVAHPELSAACLLYTSDAADDLLCVDLGGRRIIKKKKKTKKQITV